MAIIGELIRPGVEQGLRSSIPKQDTTFTLPANAVSLLDEIVDYEKSIEANGGLREFTSDSRVGILRAFQRSPLFPEIYNLLVRIAFRIEGNSRFKTRARGRVFEVLSHGYFAANQDKGVVLTSPSDTEEFFTLAEGGETFIDDEGQDAIDSIYIPDGLQIDADGHLLGVLEYKLSYGAVSSQLKRFQEVKEKLKTLSNGTEPRLTFVFPSGRNDYPVFEEREAGIDFLPIADRQFSAYVDNLILKYRRTPDSATIAEMRAEYRAQIIRRHPEIAGEPNLGGKAKQVQLGIQQIRRIGEPQFFRK